MSRPSNQTLCAQFRQILTTQFYVITPDGVVDENGKQNALEATKPWRGELWKAFKELEDRLCPLKSER